MTMEQKTPARAVRFCTAYGRALHATGSAAMRLETRLEKVSAALGVPGQFFATPTAILAQYRLPGKRRPYADLMRAAPGGVDLGLQVELEALGDDVAAGRCGLEAAETRLARTVGRPAPRWWARILPAPLISAASAVFLGGGLPEVVVAATVGAAIGALEDHAARRGSRARLVSPAAACLAGFAAVSLNLVVADLVPSLALVASLIVLVPGLEFTMAIKEISTENLVSGSARLTSAIGDFLLLAFGVALGTGLATAAAGPPREAAVLALPGWAIWLALGACVAGFALRFRVRGRDVIWVAVACLLSWIGALSGSAWLGPDLGVFVAAVTVGLAANARARWSGRSSMVMMIPGLILLVPGSFGLRAAEFMVQDDVLSAVDTVFSMALIATALSTGLLLANLLLPSEGAAAGSDRTADGDSRRSVGPDDLDHVGSFVPVASRVARKR